MGFISQSTKTYKFVKSLKDLKAGDSRLKQQRAESYIGQMLKEQGGIFLKALQYMGTQNEKIESLVYSSDKIQLGMHHDEVAEYLETKIPDLKILPESGYAASIGQVNKAEFAGELVAIKFIYPGIKKTLQEQLKLLNLIPKVQGASRFNKKWGFDFTPYQSMIEKTLQEECDLTHEVKELKRWKEYLDEVDGADVPVVYDKYANSDYYLQEFIEGQTVGEVAELWSVQDRFGVADKLATAFVHLLLKYHTVQGDSNFGNYLFEKTEQKVYFLDLGQAVQFSPKFIHTLTSGIYYKINKQSFCAMGFFTGLGFAEKQLKPIAPKLHLLIDILMEPFISSYPLNFREWHYKRDLDLLLGEDKWWFRASGGTDFFLLMKAFMGIKNLILKLDVSVAWNRIFNDFFSRFDFTPAIEQVDVEQKYLTQYHGEKILVRVLHSGAEKVKVSLPFKAIFDLADYIDPDVMAQIQGEKLDIEELIRQALADGGKPKSIFQLSKGNKEYSVSIE